MRCLSPLQLQSHKKKSFNSRVSGWKHLYFMLILCGMTLNWVEYSSGIRLLSLSLMLWPMVSWPVCLGIKYPSGTYDQIFVTVRQLWACWRGVLSLTRGQVCHLQLLLALTSAVILRSESQGTHGHILLSQIQDFPFCRLLQFTGLRWRFSTLPPHGRILLLFWTLVLTSSCLYYKWKCFMIWSTQLFFI
jgi:hypothetical protein